MKPPRQFGPLPHVRYHPEVRHCVHCGAALRYSHPQVLWFICALLLYWLSRLWIKTGRNEMHEDPIVFTLHDRGSRYVIGATIVAVILAL